MALTDELRDLLPTLSGREASVVVSVAEEIAASKAFEAELGALSDTRLRALKDEMVAVQRRWAAMMQTMTGLVARRSRREFGHRGFAAKEGHRSAVTLLQDDLGVSKAEAARLVRVAEAVIDAPGVAGVPDSETCDADRVAQAQAIAEGDESSVDDAPNSEDRRFGASTTSRPWHEPLTRAARAMKLSTTQFNAIMSGLGEPPQLRRDVDGQPIDEDGQPLRVRGANVDEDADMKMDAAAADEFDAGAIEAWRLAAESLVDEASIRTVSDLLAHARLIRDQLDPEGAERRFAERYEARSFRMVQLDNGATRAIWTLDDETALLLTSVHDAALRPRRGGPRFVDSAERTAARELSDDPRTNEQLSHDLMADLLRAGTLAEAKVVFGTRQAGVRLVQVIDVHGEQAGIVHSEDRLIALPRRVADQRTCDTEVVTVHVDTEGNPLSLGRSTRLFTPAQKLALAIRDGGCRWLNCDRPASYCEAHHIDPWEEGGKTDVERAILLCRYHHLNLHDGGWRITREGSGDFVLTHPAHKPRPLPKRAPLKYAWEHITLPQPKFRRRQSTTTTSSPTPARNRREPEPVRSRPGHGSERRSVPRGAKPTLRRPIAPTRQ